ncbi:MAG: ATP-grasp domain-containing protein [Candidatus Gracilibacteria bacterium]|nr:ATP-grasp domain-containing protein [Candidatus Gracilibacteria bacterium]
MSKPMTYWSVSSQVLKEEAEKLGLKVEVLVPEKNLFLVKGKNKEVLFKSTDFGVNSALGKKITDDKELTYKLLEKYGAPIAKTFYIYNHEFPNFDWTKLSDFHFPVIIKPIDEAHGNGVCMNIVSISELQKKLESSFADYAKMIVQEQISGDECRVLVVLGEVVVGLHRVPPFIIGDGKSTLHELIDNENKTNPLRQQNYSAPLSLIKADSELVDYVSKQGYSLDDIIPSNTKLQLRGNSNLGTGGTIIDITEMLHEDTKKLCVSIAEKFQLGICGVDILSSDFSKPLSESGGVILEINSTPGIGGDRELTSVNTGREILKKIFSGSGL